MSLLSDEQIQTTKQYLYKNSRLLERQLFEHFFGKGTKQACVNTLAAYQNSDGGFGNGIEPDILCPASTAIGAETALFVMDLLNAEDNRVLEPLLHWVVENQNEAGFIPHPPQEMYDYPFQPWWGNPDDARVFALAGYLCKLGVTHNAFFDRVHAFFQQAEIPGPDNYYSYPYFTYLKFCGESAEDKEKLKTMTANLSVLLEKHADHFPLFSRAWYHAASFLDRELVTGEAHKFVKSISEDGSLAAPYPELPWWRPIWTVDGLILLKRVGLL